MPLDSSTDPYDTNPGFDRVGSKVGGPSDRAKEFDDDDDRKDLGDDDDDAQGVATSKVDHDEVDEDLSRAGTGASRAAAIDLDDIQKAAAGTEAAGKSELDDDLEDAGSGAGLKGNALLADDDEGDLDDDPDGLDDVDKGFDVKSDVLDVDHDTDSQGSLKGAIDSDDFDDHDLKLDDDPDDPDDVDPTDHVDHDKGDFLGFH
jgi:hypothetical protein